MESSLNKKMDTMLTKMDGFLKQIKKEEQERISADAQFERRAEKLEQKLGTA